MKRFMLFIFMVFIISGCATSPKEAFKIDSGAYPENYSEMIKCYLSFHLDDPSSLKDFLVVKPPTKIKADTYYASIPLDAGEEVWECFIVYGAKNKDGNPIGKDLHVVWIRDLKIVAFDYNETELDFRIKQRQGNPCPQEDVPKNG